MCVIEYCKYNMEKTSQIHVNRKKKLYKTKQYTCYVDSRLK